MASDPDLFANFQRMRREVDEMLGEQRERGGGTWSPLVDVFYVGDPPRAVVHAELPGVDPAAVTVEVRGRELLLEGHRPPPQPEGRLYQQLELPHGTFRRVIALGADVVSDEAKARYHDGILEITLPLARREAGRRRVPVNERDRG